MRRHKFQLLTHLCMTLLLLSYNNCTGFSSAEIDQIAQTSQANPNQDQNVPPSTPTTTVPSSSPTTTTLPQPPIVELVRNSGFENGMTNWTNLGNTNIVSNPVRSGISALHLGPASGGFEQTVSVSPGKRYRLSSYVMSQPNGGIVFRVMMTLPDTSTSIISRSSFSSTYQKLAIDFTAPAGVISVKISIWNNSGDSYIDDISMYEINPALPQDVLVDEGDSISVTGTHSSMYASGVPDINYFDQAVGGSGFNNVLSRKQTLLSRKPAQGLWVVSLLIGANDLAANDPVAYSQNLFAYCDELRTAGAKVALGTVLPQGFSSSATHNQKRIVLNDLIRQAVGVHIDAVIDYAADPFIGPDAAATNTIYYSDLLHPTWGIGGGQERMFLIYKPVIDRLLNRQNQ